MTRCGAANRDVAAGGYADGNACRRRRMRQHESKRHASSIHIDGGNMFRLQRNALLASGQRDRKSRISASTST